MQDNPGSIYYNLQLGKIDMLITITRKIIKYTSHLGGCARQTVVRLKHNYVQKNNFIAVWFDIEIPE